MYLLTEQEWKLRCDRMKKCLDGATQQILVVHHWNISICQKNSVENICINFCQQASTLGLYPSCVTVSCMDGDRDKDRGWKMFEDCFRFYLSWFWKMEFLKVKWMIVLYRGRRELSAEIQRRSQDRHVLQDGLLWQRQLFRSLLTTIPGRICRWYIPLCRPLWRNTTTSLNGGLQERQGPSRTSPNESNKSS